MSDAAKQTVPRQHWYALGLLTAMYTLSSIDRNVVSIIAEPLKLEYGLTDSQLGLLTGAAFALSFAAVGLPMGLLIDRVNRTKLIAACLAIWSGLTVISGMAHAFWVLLLARIGVAGAESCGSPGAMSLITDYFPRSRRGTAIGIFFTSAPLGMTLGFAFGGLIAAEWGWRAAFFVAGAPGLILAALMYFTSREPKRGAFDPIQPGPVVKASLTAVVGLVWRRRTMLMLLLAAICMILVQAGIGAFISPFLIRVHDMPLAQTGLFAAVALGGGGFIGMPLGGMFADRLGRTSAARGQIFVAITAVASGIAAIAAFTVSSVLASMVLLFVYAVVAHLYYGATFSTYLNVAPATVRGTAGALLIVALNLGGYGLGPLLTGGVSDFVNALGIDNSLRWSLVILSCFYGVGALFFLIASLTINRDLTASEEGEADVQPA